MSIIFLSALSLIILGGALLFFSFQKDEKGVGLSMFFVGLITIVVGFFALGSIGWNGYDWRASKRIASVINHEYGTEYTREEIFYDKDTIKIIKREGNCP